jgi:hypothetical protein
MIGYNLYLKYFYKKINNYLILKSQYQSHRKTLKKHQI